jgi:hypothetical protein
VVLSNPALDFRSNKAPILAELEAAKFALLDEPINGLFVANEILGDLG